MVSISQLKAQDTLTTQQKIFIAYDSYNLVIALDNKPQPLSQKDSMARVRNVSHLKYMLAKPLFYTALTTQEKNELNAIVD